MTEIRALQHHMVWACVSLISDTLAQLPVGAFQGSGPARLPLEDPDVLVSPTGATVEWPEWMGMAAVSYLLRGNTFGHVLERDRNGYPHQVQLLHPDEVRVFFDREAGGARYRIPGVEESQRRYPVGDIWHVKGMTVPGVYRSVLGLSPIEYAAAMIGTALNAEAFGSEWFSGGGVPTGLLSTDQDIDEGEAKDYHDRWMATHGAGKRDIAVLGKGLNFEALSIKANESQFLETIQASDIQICGFYRVPPHMVGIVEKSTSWGTGIEEQALGYITYTLGAPIVRFEKALSSLLPKPQYVKYNLAALMRGRQTERFRAYLMGRQGGWLNIDEIRALEEMAPAADGKGTDYLQPLNYAPIPEGGGAADLTAEPVTVPPDSGA